MPRLSDTMEEGKILKWLKNVGDAVAIGDVLAEVETDKANMELEAFDAGVLSEIRVAEGDAAPVGAVIAVLGGEAKTAGKAAPQKPPANEVAEPEADDKEPAAPTPEAAPNPAAAAKAAPAKPASSARPAPASKPTGATAARPTAAAPKTAGDPAPSAADDRVRASPRARRIASERGIDLARVQGTGPGGRILEQDLETAPAGDRQAAPPASRGEQPTKAGAGSRRIELSKIRRTTATRMSAAKRDVPHFYASSDFDAEGLVTLKNDLRGRGGEWSSVTVTHILLKAVGLALREVPELNASWDDGALVLHDEVNVGLAVSIDDGLVVPVVRRCDTQPLAALVKQASELVARARAGRFAGDDLIGSTFTISNLGMYPVDHFAAVVNPPNAGILAVGAVRNVPVVRPGQIVPGHVMTVTLSCDHRVVDGVIAGRFLQALKARLEDPHSLLE